jgi:hypothetical protein
VSKQKLWTIYTPSDCTLQLDGETNQEQKSPNYDPTLALGKALLGMMNEEDDE